jgi:hypothetical protein
MVGVASLFTEVVQQWCRDRKTAGRARHFEMAGRSEKADCAVGDAGL